MRRDAQAFDRAAVRNSRHTLIAAPDGIGPDPRGDYRFNGSENKASLFLHS
jgi:hypothetical protein